MVTVRVLLPCLGGDGRLPVVGLSWNSLVAMGVDLHSCFLLLKLESASVAFSRRMCVEPVRQEHVRLDVLPPSSFLVTSHPRRLDTHHEVLFFSASWGQQ